MCDMQADDGTFEAELQCSKLQCCKMRVQKVFQTGFGSGHSRVGLKLTALKAGRQLGRKAPAAALPPRRRCSCSWPRSLPRHQRLLAGIGNNCPQPMLAAAVCAGQPGLQKAQQAAALGRPLLAWKRCPGPRGEGCRQLAAANGGLSHQPGQTLQQGHVLGLGGQNHRRSRL